MNDRQATGRRRQPRKRPSGRKGRRVPRLLGAVLGAAAIVAILAGAHTITDEPSSCRSCHEMTPVHDAWAKGPHGTKAGCLDCHADPGHLDRLRHKATALGTALSRLGRRATLPLPTPLGVPDSRCIRCHPKVSDSSGPVGFSHDEHRGHGTCASCHLQVGHRLTERALRSAGVLDAVNARKRSERAMPSGAVAAVSAGSANVQGHPRVSCSTCHDMSATGCVACHASSVPKPHPASRDCGACHPSARDWRFTHPDDHECGRCHRRPKVDGHPKRDDCGMCHSARGVWKHDK